MSNIQQKIDEKIVDGAPGSLTTEIHREVLNSFINPIGIDENSNIDNYTKTGRYFINGADNTAYQNLPFEIWSGIYTDWLKSSGLDVYNYVGFDSEVIVEQKFTMFVAENDIEIIEFKRRYSSNEGWSNWTLITQLNYVNEREYNLGYNINGLPVYKFIHKWRGTGADVLWKHNLNVSVYYKHEILLVSLLNGDQPVAFSSTNDVVRLINPQANDFDIEATTLLIGNLLILEYSKIQ